MVFSFFYITVVISILTSQKNYSDRTVSKNFNVFCLIIEINQLRENFYILFIRKDHNITNIFFHDAPHHPCVSVAQYTFCCCVFSSTTKFECHIFVITNKGF